MKLAAQERLVTATALAAIGLIAAMSWWTYREIDTANRQRQQASEMARGLSQLRLITFEYRLYHHERAKAQWHEVSDRVDRAIANAEISIPAQAQILARVRDRRAKVRSLFAELTSAHAGSGDGAALNQETRLFEAQLLSRLLAEQQDNFADIFRLTDIASGRIDTAQRWMIGVILAGLLLIAAIEAGASWLIHRNVLAPIRGLQQATREVASGNWHFAPGALRNDEIGELTGNFEAMTQSLRRSFERIERGNQELAALNAELEAFSYSVSHDLRGPLRSMDGFSLALLEDYGDVLDAPGKAHLNRIRSASQRMGRLIDDLLGLAQVTRAELRLEQVDLSGIAREIAGSLDGQQEAHRVRWLIDEGMTARADRALVRIAMQNLLDNAWKFTGKTPGATIRVAAHEQDGRREFFVADNGAGFDMAYADKLFEAFQRLHTPGEFPGTGIGLAIVHRIIRRHRGDIRAQAIKDEGATFYFTLEGAGDDAHGQNDTAG